MNFKIKFTKNRNIQYKTLIKCGINNIKIVIPINFNGKKFFIFKF